MTSKKQDSTGQLSFKLSQEQKQTKRPSGCVDASAVFDARKSEREARLSARIIGRLDKLHRF